MPRRRATGIRHGHGVVGGPAGPQPAGFGRFPVRAARTQDRSIPAPTGLDTTTPAGKAMFQMMGVFAEFEPVQIIFETMVAISSAEKARSDSVRILPSAPRLKLRAV